MGAGEQGSFNGIGLVDSIGETRRVQPLQPRRLSRCYVQQEGRAGLVQHLRKAVRGSDQGRIKGTNQCGSLQLHIWPAHTLS